ncbi:hypothetical protein VNO77_41734 [Canavalia gladiata]|uniref:Uncharacterized protein n=1 Tax=Canavalia gladiata TaxID=3824 RepID=A0AAN9K208_CANGL
MEQKQYHNTYNICRDILKMNEAARRWKTIDYIRILVHTPSLEVINRVLNVRVNDSEFTIRMIEEFLCDNGNTRQQGINLQFKASGMDHSIDDEAFFMLDTIDVQSPNDEEFDFEFLNDHNYQMWEEILLKNDVCRAI